MQQPMIVLNTQKREEKRKAQLSNIHAAKAVANIIRTCLGPRAMLKMLMSQMAGIVLTNDGNAILREIDVSHPAAKNMIELARSQDEQVGDGTTSVIVLAGEVMSIAEPFIKKNIHPKVIVGAFYQALDHALEILPTLATKFDPSDDDKLKMVVRNAIGTKFLSKYEDQMGGIAIDAIRIIDRKVNNVREIDIKKLIRFQKIMGGEIEDSYLLKGAVLEKDVLHSQMNRRIENPRVLLMDVSIDYEKGESQTNIEIMNDEDFQRMLQIEEEYIKDMVEKIAKFKPDLVITEKGCSDLAQHYFFKHGITTLRRLRISDSNRIAKVTGATCVNRVDMIKEEDLGTKCKLFEIRKIGDSYYAFLDECEEPEACTIILRGPNKDIVNEIERNLMDGLKALKNVLLEPLLLPGGGATEMSLSQKLNEKAMSIKGIEQLPYRALSGAFEILPRTLIQNCGGKTMKVLTKLRAKHANGENKNWGINGLTGELADMSELNVWDSYSVKVQIIKSAIESSCMLLRIDEILSGKSKKEK
ncbi:t-complex protein 1 subunit gamma [Anaeramoeba flamelloides]|uniref:T-complex protein 1 subunit gamma n=1 Tax=Anaeramoeba flamelloides TaxID=1746091 RepID=A0AAV7ZSZ7_9EUKA|nr:t-complex protein 1 subunit gamma [Anaeramoeba flamelloides]KAJ6238032.1 t-complex protein 1 subunit gamma [Anaeramoeba flamelloides]